MFSIKPTVTVLSTSPVASPTLLVFRFRPASSASGSLSRSIHRAPRTILANTLRFTGHRPGSVRAGTAPGRHRTEALVRPDHRARRTARGRSSATSAGGTLPFFDVSDAPDPRAEAETWMRADLARPVDPTRGRCSDSRCSSFGRPVLWYARYHHLVMDGFGMALVARRLADVYTRLSRRARRAWRARLAHFAACSRRTPPIAAPSSSRDDRHYWIDRLADRPEPVSLGGRVVPGNSDGFVRHTACLHPRDPEARLGCPRANGASPAPIF